MTSDTSWNRAEKVLKETFKLTTRRIISLSDVRNELRSLASGGISTAPDFTLHNEVHSDNLVSILGELCTHLSVELSEYEAYLLLAAVYLHDIGMFIGAGRFTETILPDMAHILAVCPNDQCDGGTQYEEGISGKAVDYQIRALHHLLSAHMIDVDGAAQFHLAGYDLPHIITIARGHRNADLNGRACDCYRVSSTKYGLVRRGLLASLLRLADALDFYADRAPERVFRERAWDFLHNPPALQHWLYHYFARSVYIAIHDEGGNRSLDCQIFYSVPANRTLSGRSYADFFQPLLDEYKQEVQQGDFNPARYPSEMFECAGIRDLKLEFFVKPELGAAQLPKRIADEIEQSGCENAVAFLRFMGLQPRNPPITHPTDYVDLTPQIAEIKEVIIQVRQALADHDNKTLERFNQVDNHTKQVLSRVEDAYTKLARSITSETKDGPSLFSLVPVHHSKFNPRTWVREEFRLTLWCEHSRLPLPLLNPKGSTEGVYTIELSREWFEKASPYLKLLTGTLSLVLPVASAAVKLALDDEAYKAIEEQLEMGKSVIEASLSEPAKLGDFIGAADSHGDGLNSQHGEALLAHGAVLRELHALLKAKDPGFGGLVRVMNKRQEFFWVHPKFEQEYAQLEV